MLPAQASDESTRWRALELAIVAHFTPASGKARQNVQLDYVTLDSSSSQQKLHFTIETVRLWHNGDNWDNFQLANNTLFVCPPGHPVADLVMRSNGSLYIVQVCPS